MCRRVTRNVQAGNAKCVGAPALGRRLIQRGRPPGPANRIASSQNLNANIT
jgi:hypothetical protein